MVSILLSIKKLLGLEPDYVYFDNDILMHINSALMSLHQIGVGPTEGYIVEDDTQTWSDFVGDRKDLGAIKTYVYLRARLVFDPPQTGFVVEALKEQVKELEWRLNVQAEGGVIPND